MQIKFNVCGHELQIYESVPTVGGLSRLNENNYYKDVGCMPKDAVQNIIFLDTNVVDFHNKNVM